jgi:CRISPR-associated protein Cas1
MAKHCAVFEAMVEPAALMAGFERVKRNKGGPGADGQSAAEFGQKLQANLGRLRRELVTFTYRPGPYKRYPIDKPSGGVRWIAVPSIRDRIVQTAAAAALSARIDPFLSPASFAYRPGLSVQAAAGRVTMLRLQGFVYVAEGDIADFFDSVPHRVAIDALRPYCSFAFLHLAGMWLRGFSWNGKGLAQGSPLSPVLANLVLDPVDKAVTTHRTKLVRYADDFLLMAQSAQAAAHALARMDALLRPIGLKLKAEKTRLARLDEGVKFLGLAFEGNSVVRIPA